MNDAQEMVTAFHRAFDIAIGTLPAVPDAATCALRVSLIQEECAELCEALGQRDIEAVAKELADVSVNSFLDTFGPTIRLHQLRYNVAHVSPGQGLCIRAAQSATSHCIDAGTHAAPDGVLLQYERW
jgi:hypothetical protein